MHVGALEASSGGQVMWDELGVGHRAPRVGNNTGAGIPHGIGVWYVQGTGVGHCLGSCLPPSIPAL